MIFSPRSIGTSRIQLYLFVYFKCLYYIKSPAVLIYFCLLVGPVEDNFLIGPLMWYSTLYIKGARCFVDE